MSPAPLKLRAHRSNQRGQSSGTPSDRAILIDQTARGVVVAKGGRGRCAYQRDGGDDVVEHGERVEDAVLPQRGLVDVALPVDGAVEHRGRRGRRARGLHRQQPPHRHRTGRPTGGGKGATRPGGGGVSGEEGGSGLDDERVWGAD
jgi:hypothetical protein